MISGSIKEVVSGLELILDKLHSEVVIPLITAFFKTNVYACNMVLGEQFFYFCCLFALFSFMLKRVVMLSLGDD